MHMCMTAPRWIILKRGTVLNKIYRENQNTSFMSNNFFSKNCAVYAIMWKKYGRARQATDDKIAYALFVLANYKHKHTHTQVCNTYCFSTATMVTRTRINVTLHIHCVCCIHVASELELFMWRHVKCGTQLLNLGTRRNVFQDRRGYTFKDMKKKYILIVLLIMTYDVSVQWDAVNKIIKACIFKNGHSKWDVLHGGES
jgi:hypothetical protein